MNYLRRGIEQSLHEALESSPVVIIEGARASGKTTMCLHIAKQRGFRESVDLTDPALRSLAQEDPLTFVCGLATPAFIDEGQLVEGLTLGVKAALDTGAEPGSYLLTGSARLGRGELGGSDPLAGRVRRLRLTPFAQAEIEGHPISRLPQLFELGDLASVSDSEPRERIVRRAQIGGLPTMPGVLPGRRRSVSGHELQAYVEGVLHRELGDRTDVARLRRLLKLVVGSQVQPLNVSALGDSLGFDRSTVDRYLDQLEQSFLLQRLRSFRPLPAQRDRARPWLRPVDVSLAAWASGRLRGQLTRHPEQLGHLLETLVVTELIAQAGWTQGPWEVMGWREQDREVDAVIEDPDGRLLAIEVKAAESVRPQDTAGIQAFRARHGDTRGIVLHGGTRSLSLGDDIWALPMSVLWAPDALAEIGTTNHAASTKGVGMTGSASNARPGNSLFLCYAHADDDAQGGRVVQLAKDLGQRFAALTGEHLDVLTDQDLRWGTPWKQRLDRQLGYATFMMVIVSPSMLKSEACRNEVTDFVQHAKALDHVEWLLPVLYFAPLTDPVGDPVWNELSARQWEDFTELRYSNPGDGSYLRKLDQMAQTLAQRVPNSSGPSQLGDSDLGERERSVDFLTTMEELEESLADFEDLSSQLDRALNGVISSLGSSLTDLPEAGSAKQIRAAIRNVGEQSSDDVAELTTATSKLRGLADQLDQAIVGMGVISSGLPDADRRPAVGVIRELLDPIIGDTDLDDVEPMLRAFRGLSAEARALIDPILGLFTLVRDMQAMQRRWADIADELDTSYE